MEQSKLNNISLINYCFDRILAVFCYFCCSIFLTLISLFYVGFGIPTYWFIDIFAYLAISFLFLLLPFLISNIISFCFLFFHGLVSYTIICVYASTSRLFTWTDVSLLGETTKVLNQAVFPIIQAVLILLILIIFMVLSIILKKKYKSNELHKKFLNKLIKIILISGLGFCLLAEPIISIIILNNHDNSIFYYVSDSYLYANYNSSYKSYKKFGWFGYYISSLSRTIFPFLTPQTQKINSANLFSDYTSTLDGLCENNNVLFIMAESFDEYAITKETTPVLYSLKNGIDLSTIGVSAFYNISTDENGETQLSRKDLDYNSTSKTYTKNSIDIYNGLTENQCGLYLSDYKSGTATYVSEYIAINGIKDSKLNNSILNYLPNYQSTYIHCNKSTFYGRNAYIKDQLKFNTTYFYENMSNFLPQFTNDLSLFTFDSLAVKHMLKDANFKILPNDSNFFTFMMTITTHGDYSYNENLQDYYSQFECLSSQSNLSDTLALYNNMPSGDDKQTIKTYLSSAMDTEYMMAYYINELYQTNQLNSTLILFVADHYAYASVTDFKNSYVKKTQNKETSTMSDIYTVPAIIYSTNIKSSQIGQDRNISHLTTGSDLLPTILTLLGKDYNHQKQLGYPVINNSTETNECLYNKFVYLPANEIYLNDNYYSYGDNEVYCFYDTTITNKEQLLEEICNHIVKIKLIGNNL